VENEREFWLSTRFLIKSTKCWLFQLTKILIDLTRNFVDVTRILDRSFCIRILVNSTKYFFSV